MNASRKPGEWQTYDIIFESPRSSTKDGKVTRARLRDGAAQRRRGAEPLRATRRDVLRPAGGVREALADEAPMHLQYHGNPVKFRNIWVRELKPIEGKKPEKK